MWIGCLRNKIEFDVTTDRHKKKGESDYLTRSQNTSQFHSQMRQPKRNPTDRNTKSGATRKERKMYGGKDGRNAEHALSTRFVLIAERGLQDRHHRLPQFEFRFRVTECGDDGGRIDSSVIVAGQ